MKNYIVFILTIGALFAAQNVFADWSFTEHCLAPGSSFSPDEEPLLDLSEDGAAPDENREKTELEIEIEHASLQDLNDLPYNPGYSIDRKIWTENMGPGVSFFKALCDGQLAGLIMFEPNPEKQIEVVYGLEVNEAYSRKGIARQLLLQAVYESLENNFQGRIALIPSELAKKFYYDLGFDFSSSNNEWITLEADKAISLINSLSEKLQIRDQSFEGIAPLDANELKLLLDSGRINFLSYEDVSVLNKEQVILLKKLIVTLYPEKESLEILNKIINSPELIRDLYDHAINRIYLADFTIISA